MDQKSRIFYSLLQRVGAQGTYQDTSLIFWSVIFMTIGASSFFNTFLFYSGDYICTQHYPVSCQEHVCSLPPSERQNFLSQQISSISTKFGDFRCENSMILVAIQSFIYMGGIGGVLAGTFLNQIMSKRKLMILALKFNIIGVGLTIVSSSIYMAGLGLFINFAAKCIQSEIVACYIIETVSQNRQGKSIMIIYLFYAIGASFNGLIFYLFKSWEIALIVYQLIPFLLVFIALFFYIEQTPFDLVINYDPEYSCSAFHRIAKINGRQNEHGITVEEIANIKEEYLRNQKKRSAQHITIPYLFKIKSLRMKLIISIIMHFLIAFQFSAPELSLEDYALNININGVIIGSSQIISSTFCYYFVNKLPRKRTIILAQILGLTVSFLVYTLAACSDQDDECQKQLQIVQTMGLFTYGVFITISYNFFYMTQFQMFPTQIRSLALQITAVASYTAVVITPPIQELCDIMDISIIFTFSLACLLMILFTIKIPETYGLAPPQIIDELKYSHHDLQLKLMKL